MPLVPTCLPSATTSLAHGLLARWEAAWRDTSAQVHQQCSAALSCRTRVLGSSDPGDPQRSCYATSVYAVRHAPDAEPPRLCSQLGRFRSLLTALSPVRNALGPPVRPAHPSQSRRHPPTPSVVSNRRTISNASSPRFSKPIPWALSFAATWPVSPASLPTMKPPVRSSSRCPKRCPSRSLSATTTTAGTSSASSAKRRAASSTSTRSTFLSSKARACASSSSTRSLRPTPPLAYSARLSAPGSPLFFSSPVSCLPSSSSTTLSTTPTAPSSMHHDSSTS